MPEVCDTIVRVCPTPVPAVIVIFWPAYRLVATVVIALLVAVVAVAADSVPLVVAITVVDLSNNAEVNRPAVNLAVVKQLLAKLAAANALAAIPPATRAPEAIDELVRAFAVR